MSGDLGDLEELCRLAVQEGAVDARILEADKVVVAEWVYWKCRFGCDSYGRAFTCPPYSPTPEQTRALLRNYKYGIVLKQSPSEDWHKLLLELERRAFLLGNHAALGLGAGRCRLCERCDVEGGYCLKPRLARPSMESCGIDVFATARNAGFEMRVLTSRDQEYHRICMVLVR